MEDKLICEGINSKGFGIIPKLIMQDRTIHATAKCIYAYFCSFAGAGDTCFPTRKKICFDLGISIDTFGKYLKQLIEHGYIKSGQIKENGRFSHNVYTLCSTISPCTKISDTENTVYEDLDTNNNNNKNNNIYKNNSNSKVSKKEGHEEGKNTPLTETKTETYDEIIEDYTDNPELQQTLKEYIKLRQMKKAPLTNGGLKLILQELKTFSPSTLYQIGVLQKAIMNGSSRLYELTENEATRIWEKYHREMDKFFD